jgi:hypothetical protein
VLACEVHIRLPRIAEIANPDSPSRKKKNLVVLEKSSR